MVVVAAFAASVAGVLPAAAMTVTRRATKSAANDGHRLYWPSAHRYSIATFWPSTLPASFRPSETSDKRGVLLCAGATEKADHRQYPLLSARRQRPCKRSPSKCYELAPPQACHSFSPTTHGLPHGQHGSGLAGKSLGNPQLLTGCERRPSFDLVTFFIGRMTLPQMAARSDQLDRRRARGHRLILSSPILPCTRG
jgi:hypothetical protein